MKYLFDASAIFRAIKENKTDLLTGEGTVELARYELGNIIWKNYFLQAENLERRIQNDCKSSQTYSNGHGGTTIINKEEQILETAAELNITFYDASYAYLAKEKGDLRTSNRGPTPNEKDNLHYPRFYAGRNRKVLVIFESRNLMTVSLCLSWGDGIDIKKTIRPI